MENDQLIAADAGVDPVSRSQSRRIDHSAQSAHDAVNKAGGAIDVIKSSDDENTPFLSRDIDEDRERRSETPGDGHGSENAEWSGARDFEGRPWWNRPSVSLRGA